MYAIIEDGSRQLKVEEGQELDIDYRDLAAGEEIKFERVLAFRDEAGLRIGRPALPEAVVTAKVVSLVQGPSSSCRSSAVARTTAAAPATVSFTPAC